MNTTIPFLCLLSAKKKGMASKKERKKERNAQNPIRQTAVTIKKLNQYI